MEVVKMNKKKAKKKKQTHLITPKVMYNEIALYPVYLLTARGRLTEIAICSTNEYNHSRMHLHHYIPYEQYMDTRKHQWFITNNIKQKLILMPIQVHEQVHQQAIKNLSDDDFLYKYGISRWDLIYNERYSK